MSVIAGKSDVYTLFVDTDNYSLTTDNYRSI